MARPQLSPEEPLRHYSVSLHPSQWAGLGRIAQHERLSRSVVLRRAIDAYLHLRLGPVREPPPSALAEREPALA